MKRRVISAQRLSKTYLRPKPIQILSGVSLDLFEGESVAITGPSGVGKTTLLHILGTLDMPSGGQLEIMGHEVHKGRLAQLRNQHIGFVFQSFSLFDDLSALENVMLPGRVGGKRDKKRCMRLLEMLGLGERAHFAAKLLSGGEKQRVAIARALCNDPELILADEPTGNLDETSSMHIADLLLGTCQELKKALLIATHDMALAAKCDRKLIIRDKKLSLG